jgi:hypothetical protein
MSKRYSIIRLPANVRSELISRLTGNGFSQFSELAEWLNLQGHKVSRNTVWGFAREYRAYLSAHPTATPEEIIQAMSLMPQGSTFVGK